MSELKLDVDQASEIKAMARRERGSNGSEWTNEKLKALCESKGLFGQLLDVLEDRAEIVGKKVETVALVVVEKVEVAAKKLSVWLRTKVGGLTKNEIVEKLDDVDAGNELMFKLSDWARDILGKEECAVTKKAEEADFVIVTPADLGFKENPTTDELFSEKKLAEHGLELCKPDDGPSLRLAYTNQSDGEWLPIAMKPIRDSGGCWHVFRLKRDGSRLWLSADYGAHPQFRWDLSDRLVFRSRKNQN